MRHKKLAIKRCTGRLTGSSVVKRSLAIVHGMLGGGNGGSESRAVWAAEALKHDFAVSLVTTGPVDLARLNRFYGTAVRPDEIHVRSLPIPSLLRERQAPAALRGAFAARAISRAVAEYDVLLSAYNPCDFEIPAIQCVADFSWDEELRRKYDPPPAGLHGLVHRLPWLRACYLGLCRAIAPPSGRNLFAGQDIIVANSRWTAARLSEEYGAESTVLYPPVVNEFPYVAFERRSDDFVCIGRVSPEKRIERMIRTIGAVRSRGHNVRIRIIGPLDASPYSRMIGALAEKNPEWALLEGMRVGEEKTQIMAECRYGIHGREAEPFGISVAEMVKAGCITFAPAEGGQAEVVDHPALLYRSEDEAVEKIIAVLQSDSLRDDLHGHLRCQGEKFSADNFMSGLRQIVDSFLSRKCNGSECSDGRANSECQA